MDATEIIEALGGYAQVARDIGIGRTGVFNWLKAGIPKARCLELAELAKRKGLSTTRRTRGGTRLGITLEVLMQSHPRLSPDSPDKRQTPAPTAVGPRR